MVEQKDMCSSSPTRTLKLQLTAEQPLTGECWIQPKIIPHVQGQRRSPSKKVGGVKSHLESNPIPAKVARRAQTNLVCTRSQIPHRDCSRTVFECLLWRYDFTCCSLTPSFQDPPRMPSYTQFSRLLCNLWSVEAFQTFLFSCDFDVFEECRLGIL